jgi:flagellar motor switch protein FliG
MKNKENLMKHFASVLRKRSLGKNTERGIDSSLLKYLSRKELVEILKNKHNGVIPKETNLVEMENDQLLDLIGDELFILAHLSQGWCIKEIYPIESRAVKPEPSGKTKSTKT